MRGFHLSGAWWGGRERGGSKITLLWDERASARLFKRLPSGGHWQPIDIPPRRRRRVRSWSDSAVPRPPVAVVTARLRRWRPIGLESLQLPRPSGLYPSLSRPAFPQTVSRPCRALPCPALRSAVLFYHGSQSRRCHCRL